MNYSDYSVSLSLGVYTFGHRCTSGRLEAKLRKLSSDCALLRICDKRNFVSSILFVTIYSRIKIRSLFITKIDFHFSSSQ